jgi:hypothetical protein
MLKVVSIITAVSMVCLQAMAAPITTESLIGKYKVVAKVPFQTVNLNFHITSEKEFEIQRLDGDGKPEETCNGTYELGKSLFQETELVAVEGDAFKGVFTCPSDRSKDVDFNIDFRNKTVEDLEKGTTVSVTTSLAPMKIKATVKKVD